MYEKLKKENEKLAGIRDQMQEQLNVFTILQPNQLMLSIANKSGIEAAEIVTTDLLKTII